MDKATLLDFANTLSDKEILTLKRRIARALNNSMRKKLDDAWKEDHSDKWRTILTSAHGEQFLAAVLMEFTAEADRKAKGIANRITNEELEAIKLEMADHLEPPSAKQFDLLWELTDTPERHALLASKFVAAFRKTLLGRYVADLYEGVDRAILASSSSDDEAGERLRRARRNSQNWRGWSGAGFALVGALLVASNLWVLPAMAKRISTETEHPAAVAIDRLSQYLVAMKEDDAQKRATDAISEMANTITALTSTVSTLNENVGKLQRITQIDSTDPVAQPGYVTLTAALQSIVAPAPRNDGSATPTAAEVLAAFLIADQAATSAMQSGATLRIAGQVVTDQYLVVPRNDTLLQNAATGVRDALQSLKDHHTAVGDRRAILDRMTSGLDKLLVGSGAQDPGLIQKVEQQNRLVDDAGQALRELIVTAPTLAKAARSATDTLSSVAGFVLPYAFAVLAIGAMLVSIGVTSILKGLRLRDDEYDEAVDVNRALMFGRLACVLRTQDSKPDAIIERLARIGERTRKGEGGVPLPVARALAELVEAFKKQ